MLLQVIDPHDGSVIHVLGIWEPQPGYSYKRTDFNQPTGITVSKDGVVVSDFGNKRIKVSHFGTFFNYITV
jgi:ribosomal protein S16